MKADTIASSKKAKSLDAYINRARLIACDMRVSSFKRNITTL